jgi:hypothetical protein
MLLLANDVSNPILKVLFQMGNSRMVLNLSLSSTIVMFPTRINRKKYIC